MLSKKRAFLVIVIFYNNLRAIPRHGEEHDVRFFVTTQVKLLCKNNWLET